MEFKGGSKLPLLGGVESSGWLDFSNPSRIRMKLDTEQSATLAPGRYRWEYPIYVPPRLPAYNIWTMTFCRPAEGDDPHDTCFSNDDSTVIVSFPMAGFDVGQ